VASPQAGTRIRVAERKAISNPKEITMGQLVSYPANEETYDGMKGLKIFFRPWRPEGTPRQGDMT
jgi:hypothetical protein